MTDSRADFAGYAEAWATRADRYATGWAEARQGGNYPAADVHYEGCILAREMATMWATIAQLHPAAPMPSGKDFFLNSSGFTDILGLHAETVAEASHGEVQPGAPVRCGYCGCTDDPANCACDHDGTGSSASKLGGSDDSGSGSCAPGESTISPESQTGPPRPLGWRSGPANPPQASESNQP